MAEPEELRRVAEVFTVAASELDPLLSALAAYFRPDVWTGRVADRFGAGLDDHRRQLRVAADELRRQAAELRARATFEEVEIGPYFH